MPSGMAGGAGCGGDRGPEGVWNGVWGGPGTRHPLPEPRHSIPRPRAEGGDELGDAGRSPGGDQRHAWPSPSLSPSLRTPSDPPRPASPPSDPRLLPGRPSPLPAPYPPSPSPPLAAEPSSGAPGTAVQPQEAGAGAGAEALPLPALLLGAPALLGLALALVLVAALSWRRLRRPAPPKAADTELDGEFCVRGRGRCPGGEDGGEGGRGRGGGVGRAGRGSKSGESCSGVLGREPIPRGGAAVATRPP